MLPGNGTDRFRAADKKMSDVRFVFAPKLAYEAGMGDLYG